MAAPASKQEFKIKLEPGTLRQAKLRGSYSLLLLLSPELQTMVIGCLSVREDLRSLCQTCKTLHTIALPRLYETVALAVPVWSTQLEFLESLISASGQGLQFTTHLRVAVRHGPPKANQMSMEDDLQRDDNHGTGLVKQSPIPKPNSSALNLVIRLLIKKLHRQRLESFIWSHTCGLDPSTVALLFETQGTSLARISFSRVLSCKGALKTPESNHISQLYLKSLEENLQDGWPCHLLAQNLENLRQLELGIEERIVNHYHDSGAQAIDKREISNSVYQAINELVPSKPYIPAATVTLDSLSLCGLDINGLLTGNDKVSFDFTALTAIRLESCCNLQEAFKVLMNEDVSSNSPSKLPNLTKVVIRQEDANLDFSVQLLRFLIELTCLESLEVLLEGVEQSMRLLPLLEKHGKTLHTLVWDERLGRRTTMSKATLLLGSSGRLRDVACNCPNLTALGLSVNWSKLQHQNTKNMLNVTQSFQRLPKLETLQICNLPIIERPWLPPDDCLRALATMFMDIVASGMDHIPDPGTGIKTIALSVPTYVDARLGTSHLPYDTVRDYLSLRVYKVDYYRNAYGSGISPVLNLVSKGSAAEAYRHCSNIGILENYWLG